METKTIEEKVKTVILAEIKTLANEAWCNPTDDNICKMFNAVEYLQKVLKKDNYISPISSWQQPQPFQTQPSQPQPFQTQPSQPLQRDLIWGNDHIMAHDTLSAK